MIARPQAYQHRASMHPRDIADHGHDHDKTEQIEKSA
jgi:hypothetical protein